MAIDPGTGFNDNDQENQQSSAPVNRAALANLVEGLESELLKIKDKVHCLEEKITFLDENMLHVVKTFFYDTESFNEFMFNNVKNYDFLLTGLKGYKPAEDLVIFRSYKDFLNFKKIKNYQERPQPFNPVQQQPFNPVQQQPFNPVQQPLNPFRFNPPNTGVWQGNQPLNTGSQNFGQNSTMVHQAASMLMGIAGLNLDFKKAIALVEAALKEANK